MSRIVFLLLLLLLISSQSVIAVEEDRELALQLPPDSLGKWYKPANERDVWLHTMFRLRREMQAISEYAALEDAQLLKKWLARLQKDYRSIGEMVPEWKDELESELLEKMAKAADSGELEKLQTLQRRLGKSCRSCHVEYKLSAALRYRTPDFSRVLVESEETMEEEKYGRAMSRLTMLVNRIKIASEDRRADAAMTALDELQQRLLDLEGSCASCHKQERQRQHIFGQQMRVSLDKVREGIGQGNAKQVGRYIGKFAVDVCASCHAIHRSQSDLRELLSGK